MHKFILLLISVIFFQLSATGQKVKKRHVKRAFKKGKVELSELNYPEKFYPGEEFEIDMEVLIDGDPVLASEFIDIIWGNMYVNVSRGELVKTGYKTFIKTSEAHLFNPPKTISFSVFYKQYKLESGKIQPDYCYPKFVYESKGKDGKRGSSTYYYNGQDGTDGLDGESAPNLTVEIEETTLNNELFILIIVNDKEMILKPDCGTITIRSIGGNGGNGGTGGNGKSAEKKDKQYTGDGQDGGDGGYGGNGGNGGNITVSGSKLFKYKSILTVESIAGKGGTGGAGGRGGSGINNGDNGEHGENGSDGLEGVVKFIENEN